MPTVQVRPDQDLLLQSIADSLIKAKKVVVITGAGISTNSGIPDFRSENGLYSLIQAQFDVAAKNAVVQESSPSGTASPAVVANDAHERPLKRRKLSSGDLRTRNRSLRATEEQASTVKDCCAKDLASDSQSVISVAVHNGQDLIKVEPLDINNDVAEPFRGEMVWRESSQCEALVDRRQVTADKKAPSTTAIIELGVRTIRAVRASSVPVDQYEGRSRKLNSGHLRARTRSPVSRIWVGQAINQGSGADIPKCTPETRARVSTVTTKTPGPKQSDSEQRVDSSSPVLSPTVPATRPGLWSNEPDACREHNRDSVNSNSFLTSTLLINPSVSNYFPTTSDLEAPNTPATKLASALSKEAPQDSDCEPVDGPLAASGANRTTATPTGASRIQTPPAKIHVVDTRVSSSAPENHRHTPPFQSQTAPLDRTPSDLSRLPLSFNSSPLSSPPPILFDPYEPSSTSTSQQDSSVTSSTTSSETDESPPSSNPFSASQTSTSSRASLPNMKGRDLFDASIWSDPLRTSVFYTFATTLRQKVKDVEPTSSHYFISHLRDRGKLVRCYTQNIDQIEEKVGLCTSLQRGPGNRGRFSTRKSTGLVDARTTTDGQPDTSELSVAGLGGNDRRHNHGLGGVECVFLHGSLEWLRCFQCGRICEWDEGGRTLETLSGRQPECPHCVGATVAREEKGKRALGVGRLRPDIVLYGEEHPNAHLISPIVTHDLALYPDLMLILGTSLKVHGLKVLVKEFAKTVHSRGGKVVFVNFTKPSESSWGDVIDYWIQWDCDAWVGNLKDRIPVFWLPPGSVIPGGPKKKRDSLCEAKVQKKVETKKPPKPLKAPKPVKVPKAPKPSKPDTPPKPPALRPAALRDHKVNGAYLTWKILTDLRRITGTTPPSDLPLAAASHTPTRAAPPHTKPKFKRSRKSAPAVMAGAGTKQATDISQIKIGNRNSKASVHTEQRDVVMGGTLEETNSILAAVKSNPRRRKRKTIDGVEVSLPVVTPRSAANKVMSVTLPRPFLPLQRKGKPGRVTPKIMSDLHRLSMSSLTLPPLQYTQHPYHRDNITTPPKPEALEPLHSPSGPLSSISPNMQSRGIDRMKNPFWYFDALVNQLRQPPDWSGWTTRPGDQLKKETEAAIALEGMRKGS